MADILTLAELKTARGEEGTENDIQYGWFLTVVSQVFRQFTGRDFGSSLLTEERSFQYDGSGFLDIDDAATVSEVKLVVPYGDDQVLDPAWQWYPQPYRRDDSPVYYYLVLPGMAPTVGPVFSPEMGFNRNLDVYYRENRLPGMQTTIKVTATWGWPVVPVDIKQAAIWTINDWLDKDSEGENLTSEAIAGYARSWSRGNEEAPAGLAIPSRARDILVGYSKLEV